jgi:probable phosphoglycerate mutase
MKVEALVETSPFPERETTRASARQVFLVRHGETGGSLSGHRTGVGDDIPLTEHARHTARRWGPVLARERFGLVLTSPLGRASATCTLAGLGDLAETDWDLREWDYGEYEGLTPNEIEGRELGWSLFRDGCPHGESPEAVSTRVDRVIDRVRGAHGHVALFAHGHVFQVLAARWLGLPAFGGHHFLLDTATVNILSYDNGIPAIKRWNAPLGPPAEETLEDA